MKFWRHLLAIWTITGSVPMTAAADQPDNVDMISWERQDREPGGGFDRITLWADGRSEILLQRFGGPLQTKTGWRSAKDEVAFLYSNYRKVNPISPADAKKKFADALAAGVEQLRSFETTNADESATVVRIQRNAKLKTTVVPDFKNGDVGSENHRHFLALKKIFGDFDTDPFETDE